MLQNSTIFECGDEFEKSEFFDVENVLIFIFNINWKFYCHEKY